MLEMMCSICGRRFATPWFGGTWAHSVARPRVPISSLLTHMVDLLPFLSYLAGSKSVSVALQLINTFHSLTSTSWKWFLADCQYRSWCYRPAMRVDLACNSTVIVLFAAYPGSFGFTNYSVVISRTEHDGTSIPRAVISHDLSQASFDVEFVLLPYK